MGLCASTGITEVKGKHDTKAQHATIRQIRQRLQEIFGLLTICTPCHRYYI